MPKGQTRRRRSDATRSDTSRAVAFSDAIIAIVITLLVLDLRPPRAEPGDLLPALLGEWPTYLAYAASYTYLAVIWMNHKPAFSRIREMDRGLQWANLGILATLALVPWPTAVIAETARTGNLMDERVAVGLYAIIGALLCLAWLVFFSHLARHPDLTKEEVDDSYFARERPRALIGVALYLAAGTAGVLIHPLVASVIFLLVPAFYGFTSHGLDQGQALLRGSDEVVDDPPRRRAADRSRLLATPARCSPPPEQAHPLPRKRKSAPIRRPGPTQRKCGLDILVLDVLHVLRHGRTAEHRAQLRGQPMRNITSRTSSLGDESGRRRIRRATMLGASVALSIASAIPAVAASEEEASEYRDERVAVKEFSDPTELRALLNKSGGMTTHPHPADPDLTLTTWADEGRSLVSSAPIERDANGEGILAAGEWYCETQIPEMRVVNGGLEWGGGATCEGDHTPSWVVVRFEDTCAANTCIIWETKRGPYQSPSYQDFTRVKILAYTSPCSSSEERKMRVEVKLFVRNGVHVTTRYHPDYKLKCHVKK